MSKSTKITAIVVTVLLVLVILLVIAYFILGGVFYSIALDPDNISLFENIDINGSDQPGDPEGPTFDDHNEWFAYSGFTIVGIQSDDNKELNLSAYKLMQKEPSNKWVILIHGYRGEALSMRYYAYHYYEMGFNILMPDLRGHGNSEGDYIGMGWHDSNDILSFINKEILRYDTSARIAIMGVSMGGATTMMTTGLDLPSNVKVAVEDCGYTNVYEQFKYVLTNTLGLPSQPIMSAASTVARLYTGYNLKKADALTRLRNSKTPTLFIHGDKDDFVPYYMLDEVYNACAAPKQKLTISGAAHAQSAIVHSEVYWTNVKAFISQYIK